MGFSRLRQKQIEAREAERNSGPLKTCEECGETKPLAQFHKRKGRGDGYYDECEDAT